MLELIISVIFCWLFFEVCKLMLKIAWGATKILAMLLSVLAIPTLIAGVLLAGGVILLLPIALLVAAIVLLKQ